MIRRDRAIASGPAAVSIAGSSYAPVRTTYIGTQVLGASAISLMAAAKDPRTIFNAAEIDAFIGRKWLSDEIDRFMAENSCGYVFFEAEAGLGKTAFAAWLVKSRGYLSHFSRYSTGGTVQVALANLSAQLITQFGLDNQAPGAMLPEWFQTPGGFESLLGMAAKRADRRQHPVVLVVDGLDEGETPGEGLPFGLPSLLPDGVFVVGTYRTGRSPRRPEAPVATVRIAKTDQRNLHDIRDYLTKAAAEDVLAARLAEADMPTPEFVAMLTERCDGVWVYLRYVLNELRIGLRRPDEISGLPSRLRDYYADQIGRWQQDPQWHKGLLPLVATLGVAEEALSAVTLARLAGNVDTFTVQRWCDITIRPLLTATHTPAGGGQRRYEIYHSSFRELLNANSDEATVWSDYQQPDGLLAQAHELRQAAVAAHNRISDTYLNRFGGLDPGLPLLAADLSAAEIDDGYPLRHLARHLCGAGRSADLHALLAVEHPVGGNHTINTWFAAHDHCDSILGYLADQTRARSDSAVTTDRSLTTHRPAGTLGMEVRYALMTASIASLTANISVNLLEQLIRAKLWSPQRGLDHARRIIDPQDRLNALIMVCSEMNTREQPLVLAQVLDAAIAGGDSHANELAALAPYLPPDLLARALDAASALTDSYSRAYALTGLAPHLPPDLLARALDAATAITEDDSRARTLAELIPHIPAEQQPAVLARALDAATAITEDDSRARTLAELIPHIPAEQQPAVLARALDATTTITEDDSRARTLAELIPHIPAEQQPAVLARALDAATAITDDYSRARALTGLAPHLPPDLLTQALAAATAITRHDTDSEAWLEATDRADDYPRADTLVGLAPHLPPDLLARALDAATALTGDDSRARALTGLAPHLPPDLLARALDAATALTDDRSRARALTGLAPHVPAEEQPAVLARALDAATAIADGYSRADALAGLAPHVPAEEQPAVLARALDAATAIADDHSRFDALAGLAPHVPAEEQPAVLARALDAATALTHDDSRARALTGLAPHLPPDLLARALDAATALTNDRSRADMLTGLAPHLPPDLLARALDAATAITDDYSRARALTGLAPHVPAEEQPAVLARALDAATALTYDRSRADALTGLAPHLPPDLLARALDAATAITDDYPRADTLVGLAPHLPPDLLARALDAATALTGDDSRARALTGLAPHLPPDLLARALDAAAALTDDDYRADALTGLAPHVPAEEQPAVLARPLDAATTTRGYFRARALTRLAPHLPPDLLARAFDAATAITDGYSRARYGSRISCCELGEGAWRG